MSKKCDIFTFYNKKVLHYNAEINHKDELTRLENLAYQIASKKPKVFIIVEREEENVELITKKATIILPPVIIEEEREEILRTVYKVLSWETIKATRFYVLNYKDINDSLDIEYHEFKSNKLNLVPQLIEIYLDEKEGTLTEEEREELDNLRNFDLAKILLEEEDFNSLNPNMGTILVTQDGTNYELPGVYGYHETASAVTLAKHYHDKKYLNFGIAEIVNSGEVSITLNHMSIFVYRPLVLTEKQALYLNAFKEKIKILKEGYPEIGKYLEVICLIPTGRNDFSVLDFMQDETSLANYQNEDIDKLMMLSDELSKADTHIKR